jgi:hypothetical protein
MVKADGSSGLNFGSGQHDEAIHSLFGSTGSCIQVSPVPGIVDGARQLECLVCGDNERLVAGNELDLGEGGAR